jgi:hypothetical protein
MWQADDAGDGDRGTRVLIDGVAHAAAGLAPRAPVDAVKNASEIVHEAALDDVEHDGEERDEHDDRGRGCRGP